MHTLFCRVVSSLVSKHYDHPVDLVLDRAEICGAKTKVLISCAVSAQLICAFVFAYAKSRFSYDAAHFAGV